MADLLINEKTYEGVNEIQIPLADGSGNAIFDLQDSIYSRFKEMFNYVGTYNIETATNDDESLSSYVLKNSFADYIAKISEKNQNDGIFIGNYSNFLIVPETFNNSQSDLLYLVSGMDSKTKDDKWAYTNICVYWNTYYKYPKGITPKFNASNLTVNYDMTADIEIMKVVSDCVISSTKAHLFLVTHPLS